jgi:hypothetical protein
VNDDNPLLEAWEALTKPVRSKVIQDGPTGTGLAGQKTVTVELPPRINQLEEAIRATIGIGGSGSPKHQRNMLDADALYRFVKISTTIREWATSAKTPITKDNMTVTLQAWYVKYVAGTPTLDSERFHTRQMKTWAREIDDKLNPARIWETPGDCPVCGANTWWSKSTHEEYKFPLVIRYHETGPNLVQEAEAMCRACEQVWSVRELAYALENNDEETKETA